MGMQHLSILNQLKETKETKKRLNLLISPEKPAQAGFWIWSILVQSVITLYKIHTH